MKRHSGLCRFIWSQTQLSERLLNWKCSQGNRFGSAGPVSSEVKSLGLDQQRNERLLWGPLGEGLVLRVAGFLERTFMDFRAFHPSLGTSWVWRKQSFCFFSAKLEDFQDAKPYWMMRRPHMNWLTVTLIVLVLWAGYLTSLLCKNAQPPIYLISKGEVQLPSHTAFIDGWQLMPNDLRFHGSPGQGAVNLNSGQAHLMLCNAASKKSLWTIDVSPASTPWNHILVQKKIHYTLVTIGRL